MKKKYMILLSALSLASSTFAQTWIWYPGDYEIWLGNQMNNRRTERGAFFPPFWKTDSHYVVVEFSKQLNLSEPEEIFIAAEGKYNVKLDGKLQFGMPETMLLPAGKHNLNIKVWNQATPPTIYVKGKTVNSDSSWRVTYEDKEWIDESGKASDTSATIYMDAGCWNFDGATQRPSQFSLMREPQQPATKTEQPEGGILYDFGKETFGFITLKNLSGKGKIEIYYGESPEEAKDKAYCETLDKLLLEPGQVTDLAIRSTSPLSNSENEYTLENSKVSVVMNFTKPTENKPALLTFNEVETFLHEFGHSLHGMFANSTYRSLSGTNVYWDFVELPSQIMENFAIEKDFLNTFARHYQTGEVLPDELIKRLVDASNFNIAYACLRQLSFGLLDMAWYTRDTPFEGDVKAYEQEAWKDAQILPVVPEACMSTQFSHIFAGGYAAGYYSYKWAEVLDADAFSLFKQKGIFNQEVADSFRNNILSKGGTEHPMVLYKRFRGQEPSIDALLIRNGIKK